MLINKERSKEFFRSYKDLINNYCSQSSLITYVRDIQSKINNGEWEDEFKNQVVKSKHIANCIIKMRERFSIGEDDPLMPVRKIALLDKDFKFSFKRRTDNALSLQKTKAKFKNLKNMKNYKVIDKNFIEFYDSNIDIPKRIDIKSSQNNTNESKYIQRLKGSCNSLEVIHE